MAREKPPKHWHVAVERHRDGGLHWHVMVLFDPVPGSRGIRQFDVDGLHPNIRLCVIAHFFCFPGY